MLKFVRQRPTTTKSNFLSENRSGSDVLNPSISLSLLYLNQGNKIVKSQRLTFISAFILTFVFTAFSQTPTPTPTVEEDEGVIEVKSRLIIVPVSVLDSNGQAVTGLTAKDFRVSEENKIQEIAEVSAAEKVPLEIVILFDISSSTDSMFQYQQETAAQFLKTVMRSEDRATVFTLGSEPKLILSRETAEKSAAAIKNIQPLQKPEFTAFYDSVSAAAEHLQKNTPQGRRKVVIVISDGEDTNSVRIAKAIQDGYRKLGSKIDTMDTKTLYQMTVANRDKASLSERERVVKGLQNADTVFYSINPAGNSLQLNKMSRFGQENLQRFADDTGGTAFLPKFLPTSNKDELQNAANTRRNSEILQQIFRQLTNELQAQYLIQYYSDTEFPVNRYVKLDIGLQNPRNFRTRARQGYFVK